MTRLTKDIRKAIAAAAVAHAFDPRDAAAAQEADSLAREAYAFVIPEGETRLVEAVPSNWFRRDACLRFNVGGYTIRLNLSARAFRFRTKPKARHGAVTTAEISARSRRATCATASALTPTPTKSAVRSGQRSIATSWLCSRA